MKGVAERARNPDQILWCKDAEFSRANLVFCEIGLRGRAGGLLHLLGLLRFRRVRHGRVYNLREEEVCFGDEGEVRVCMRIFGRV